MGLSVGILTAHLRNVSLSHRNSGLNCGHKSRTTCFLISEGDQEQLLCPAECPTHQHGRPVCASDGKFYRSACAFQEARCEHPHLQVWPRFRCRGATRRDNNSKETRTGDGLEGGGKLTQAPYVPECSENGAFLEVQCHKQTGYCWCSTPEGKPIAGTSALNQAPNCTGKAFREGSNVETSPVACDKLLALQIQLLFLLPCTGLSSNAEYPPSCEQERREAIHEARQHQQEGTFIPECEGDGTYKEVQCHQATGYCWCVRVDTGRPIPGTSTRNFPPDCEAETATKSTEIGPLFQDRILPGKSELLPCLEKQHQEDMVTLFPDSLAAPSLEDRAVRWQFTHLDRDFSNGVSERELRPFKLYMKQNARPKRCVRKFLDYCDLSGNKLISLPEFRGCLGLKLEGTL
uniref:SPARC-related modular calcium-binding protein 2 n=1 Tax=Naja naja TaxID=35670 RepID=A0A8C6Y6P8_NAJNA